VAVWGCLEVEVVLALEKSEGIGRRRERRKRRRKDWLRYGGTEETAQRVWYSMRLAQRKVEKLSVIAVCRLSCKIVDYHTVNTYLVIVIKQAREQHRLQTTWPAREGLHSGHQH
jgi:hypothetical protein